MARPEKVRLHRDPRTGLVVGADLGLDGARLGVPGYSVVFRLTLLGSGPVLVDDPEQAARLDLVGLDGLAVSGITIVGPDDDTSAEITYIDGRPAFIGQRIVARDADLLRSVVRVTLGWSARRGPTEGHRLPLEVIEHHALQLRIDLRRSPKATEVATRIGSITDEYPASAETVIES